ncbi:MAG: ribokinase [Actinomycetota bacterium]
MADSPEIVVVGSINLDLSVTVDRFPDPGETLFGHDVQWGGGGKGANQAVAAARLGRRVAMIGRVGDDEAGRERLAALAAEGIDVDGVAVTDGVASGLAVIEVETSGENRIVVAPGANGAVSPEDVSAWAGAVADAPVVLAQLEVPTATVESLAALPRRGLLLVNPAPATAGYRVEGVDVLVPNRTELALLVDAPVAGSNDEVIDQVVALGTATAGLSAVVATLGGDGAVVVERPGDGSRSVTPIAAVPVTPVDTTAAGDSFCGALADALCLGADLVDSAGWAARVAAVTVTRRGAQASLPTRADVVA